MVDVEPKGIKIDKISQPIKPKTIDNPKIPPTKDIAFKGDNGKHYDTSDALRQANEAYFQQTNRYKSSILGREYPVTAEGAKQIREDEAAYWQSHKKGK